MNDRERRRIAIVLFLAALVFVAGLAKALAPKEVVASTSSTPP